MKNWVVTSIASCTIMGLLACKEPADQAQTKDFAFDANAKNFAIVAGYAKGNERNVAYDVANWDNLIKREQLGKFTPIYIETKNVSLAALTKAFEDIGQQAEPTSTVMFSLSSPGGLGQLVIDRAFVYRDLALALQEGLARNQSTKQIQRFYMFIETAVAGDETQANNHREAIFKAFNDAERQKNLFKEALLFVSTSTNPEEAVADTDETTVRGRLSYEFPKSLDLMVKQIQEGSARPSLLDFFNSITRETNGRAGHKAAYRVRPLGLEKETLFPAGFTPEIEPTDTSSEGSVVDPFVNGTPPATPSTPETPTSPTSPTVPGGPSTITGTAGTPPETPGTPPATTPPTTPPSVAPTLSLALTNSLGAPTNLSQEFKGQAMLVEISASWCGPCQNFARTMSQAASASNAVRSGSCSVATILVTDNNSSMAQWSQTVGPEATAHSFQAADSNQLKSSFLPGLGGQRVAIQYYPTVFLVTNTGEVISTGEQNALGAFRQQCP